MASGSALKPRPDSDSPEHQPIYDDDPATLERMYHHPANDDLADLEEMGSNVLSDEDNAARERARLARQEERQTADAGSSSDTQAASPDKLSDAESNADDRVGKGYQAEQGSQPSRMRRFARGLKTKKGLISIGGTASFFIILFLMSSGFSAFELVNLRENLLGNHSSFTNHILSVRRGRDFAKMIRKLGNGTFEENINKASFKADFEKNGFIVEFDQDGKLTRFGFTDSNGTTKNFDLKATDIVKATDDFFKGEGFGQEVSAAYDRTLNGRGVTWRGPFARALYKLYGFVFYDWADRKPSSKATTPQQQEADIERHANDIPPDAVEAAKSAEQIANENISKDAQGNPIKPEALDTALLASQGLDNNGEGINQLRQDLLNDPTATDQSVGLSGSDTVQSGFTQGVESAMSGDLSPNDIKGLIGNFAKKLPGTVLSTALKSLNAVNYAQIACRIEGTLDFVANVRNVMLSIELARFAVLWLSAADNQKAGILTSEGLNLLMIYLHTPSPDGTYWSVINSGKATKNDRSRFGTGRNNDGILSDVLSFIHSIPGSGHCSFVNNGFVVVGGFAVGIVAAIFSGGTEYAADLATSLTLALVQQLVFEIATPLLIKVGAHMLFDGYENGTTIGAGILSGYDTLLSMDGGAQALRPATRRDIQLLAPGVKADAQYAMAHQSAYDRYLNPGNGTSLVARIGMSMPNSLWSLRTSISTGGLNLFNHMTNFGVLSFLRPASASADVLSDDQTCTDPQIKKYDIATDTFCNPIMANSPDLDLDQTESILKQNDQIDDSGQPTDTALGGDLSFNKFVDDCFRGRPGILYNASPDQSGDSNPNDDTCVTGGSPLPGDTVGKYDRFTTWWGYIVDRDNLLDQVGT